MSYVVSADGTAIAYERRGSGSPVILVGGGLDNGSETADLAAQLAEHFAVYCYAKRGVGDSGDTLPYSMQREIEDIAALIAHSGETASLYGISGGGALALEAAAAGLAIRRLVVYEVPYDTAAGAAERRRAYLNRLEGLLAEGRRGDALALFMHTAGSSAQDISGARLLPVWPELERLAHTLARGCGAFGPVPSGRLKAITCPTLVATGGTPDPHMSGLRTGFFDDAAAAITASIPNAQRVVIHGQSHLPDAAAIAPVLVRFLNQ